jgi:1-acyl-sn-glycerol-3-phosphate acyltransferase
LVIKNKMKQIICQLILFKLLRYKQLGETPTADKYLFVGLPHTSNWDFLIGWLAIKAMGLDVTIFAKDAYFVWPLNYLCKLFGVAPVNRRESTNFVDAIARQYTETDKLAVLLAPEGTRKFQLKLKTGYYYLAKKAAVPIVLAGPDYKNRTFTIMPAREPMDTLEEDVADLIEFCKSMHARNPKQSFE